MFNVELSLEVDQSIDDFPVKNVSRRFTNRQS
jgi:hypothetical protein